MSTRPERIDQGIVPRSTVVPAEDSLFVPYFTRTYEDLADAINAKDGGYFAIPITSTATNIPNIANFGSFIVCISGVESGLPCITAALCKSSSSAIGSVVQLTFQAGSVAPWVAATLTITSTAANFQVAHSVVGKSGNFNIKIIGTQ
jgi:hypothetical protein